MSDDRPRLRPLDGYPVTQNGQKMFTLRDPSLVTERTATLPPAAVAVIQLCDGHTTRDEICAEFFKRYRQKLARPALDGLLASLDDAFLLDSDRFRQHSAKLFGEFAQAESRAPLHAGRSYPKDADALRKQLDMYFEPPNGPGKPSPGTGELPRALVVPHVDFHRGGPAYAWAYKPLADAKEKPEAIVVLGTDHNGADHVFTLTAKHFETPLGTVKTDVGLVRDLAEKTKHLKGGGAGLFTDEHHHRGEHTIEFQMVWLKHLLGDALDGIPVVPVLCGAMHDLMMTEDDPFKDERVGGFLLTLASLLEGKRVLWIAGADLAHVGPRYGDTEPLNADDRTSLEKRDNVTLAPVVEGDALGWFSSIRAEQDRRRVCGLTPIYAMLAAANPGKGHLAVYAQCPAEEGSVVSIASIVYP